MFAKPILGFCSPRFCRHFSVWVWLCMSRAGTGGSNLPDIPAEFSDANHSRGAVSMARAQNPNSANSQFFIVFNDASFLDGQYTVWAQVVEGMELVDNITRGEPPQDPDKIIKMEIID